jgi:proteasome lid subunit RPN8/RPN11
VDNDELNDEAMKEVIKKRMEEIRIKKELLEEIYDGLKSEEKDKKNYEKPDEPELVAEKIVEEYIKPEMEKKKEKFITPDNEKYPLEKKKPKMRVEITVRAILKIASHALKYARENIPKSEWVEVIGLLAGKFEEGESVLVIEDAYPMGHGNAIYAEIKDYKNYVKAWKDIRKNKLFVAGWYHSHPSYGLFMSKEDMGTQARYQTLWDKALALVIDPYQIDGTSLGFKLFRANLRTRKWFSVPFKVKEELDVKSLPGILNFMSPIIEGKAAFLEYDEE